jgi:Ribbon-helix-helix protein, copG family
MTLKLPEDLFAEISSEARARNISKSQVVRERLANRRTAKGKGSLWNQIEDLVISSDSMPADLSSNKAHLKSYGQNRANR